MILRRTQSLCPVCLRRLDAAYERPDGQADTVILRKTCPDHGTFSVPVWRVAGMDDAAGNGAAGGGVPPFETWRRPKSPSYPPYPRTQTAQGCPYDCGLCPAHAQHTCTGLFEVTMRCDMACPVCYAGAGGVAPPDPDMETVEAQMDSLKAASGPCNVQISGGEPTVREDLPAIVALARRKGFGLVQINTNGLRLAREKGYARRLREAGLDSVYLQWDGVSERAFAALRGRECLVFKRSAVAACAEAGLGVVLVGTLVRGVNDGEVGDLLRLALSLGPAVRGLHLQPAAFFGRYPWTLEGAPRLTLPEVMGALSGQAPELVSAAHFHPPGCENELCSFSAVYRRIAASGENGGAQAGLEWLPDGAQSCCSPGPAGTVPPPAAEGARKSRQFVALHWKGGGAADSAPRGSSLDDAFGRFLAGTGAGQRFTLSCMAFQDALSLDIDRVRGCCIHVVRPDGRMIPFCLHNLTARDGARLHGERS